MVKAGAVGADAATSAPPSSPAAAPDLGGCCPACYESLVLPSRPPLNHHHAHDRAESSAHAMEDPGSPSHSISIASEAGHHGDCCAPSPTKCADGEQHRGHCLHEEEPALLHDVCAHKKDEISKVRGSHVSCEKPIVCTATCHSHHICRDFRKRPVATCCRSYCSDYSWSGCKRGDMCCTAAGVPNGGGLPQLKEILLFFMNKKICRRLFQILGAEGAIKVPFDATDAYCGGPCLSETNLVLKCIDDILYNFRFYNGASVRDVRYALHRGCGHGGRRGDFGLADRIDGAGLGYGGYYHGDYDGDYYFDAGNMLVVSLTVLVMLVSSCVLLLWVF
ncbi:hypothetical protein Taro_010037 [Colocasia esculenta]|uniref:DUF7731 domain-containing protein n=1 Tax=Colocasia esculenta TaxID=4460 RepID=A0A843U1Y1_COLES|nr:hypothetical protein [Colocasia esculenta]